MEEHKEKEWNDFMKKTVRCADLESPSPDFTEGILQQIQAEKRRKFEYTPLISKKVWGFLGLVVIAFFVFTIWDDSRMEVPRWFSFDMEGLLKASLVNKLLGIQLSHTVLYSIVALAFFITLQVVLLRNQINKRLLPN